jgi:hypothetical protein
MTKFFCDRCGEEIVVPRHDSRRQVVSMFRGEVARAYVVKTEVNIVNPGRGDSPYPDLCDECFNRLVRESL